MDLSSQQRENCQMLRRNFLADQKAMLAERAVITSGIQVGCPNAAPNDDVTGRVIEGLGPKDPQSAHPGRSLLSP